MKRPYFIQVILPLALRGAFTYRVPEHLIAGLEQGKRVVVPFGKRRYYAALVHSMDVPLSAGLKPKDIEYVIDDTPVVTPAQMRLWEWMGFYYMSGPGNLMNTALPNAMKMSSKTTVSLNPHFTEYVEFTDDERMVIAQLSTHENMSIDQLERLAKKRAIQRAVNSLLKKGVVLISEEIKDQPKPQTVEHVVLHPDFSRDEKLSALLDGLANAPKQFGIIMRFLEMRSTGNTVPKKLLLERSHASSASLKSLADKGVFVVESVLRYGEEGRENKHFELNEDQLRALDLIRQGFEDKKTVLLHGVTGSGKTLVYTELIRETIAAGKQVLYLVPEIALTTQLVMRLKEMIGEEVLVYHSRFSDRERLTTWLRLLDSANNEIVIGARSALFLPFNNLGLIIVDEEHERSFKQHESAPHYNARDAAIWMANDLDARVILGSATPSVETSHNALKGKYFRVAIDKRHANTQLPLINVVDMTKSKGADVVHASFSGELVEAIKGCLAQHQQVILFQNRRGYAPFLLCESCGWNAECVNCDVSLTYHRHFEKMLCHYCGYNIKMPPRCPQCASAKLTIRGFGTEKIENELEILFPKARIARMDLDTTRKKMAFQNIINAFEDGSIDILVGTQMVTKGLDFMNVGLVGVLNADSLWNRPDFRAFERSYQLLTQVAGRAGRVGKRGRVLIQTFRVDHPVLDFVVNKGYDAMFSHQLTERRQFEYPPFARMIAFQLTHPDAKLVREAAQYFAGLLRSSFGKRVLGPEEPPIPRLRGRFIRQVFLKMEMQLPIKQVRDSIWHCIDRQEGHESYRKVRVQIDVDPN